jgi:hypothetical protein
MMKPMLENEHQRKPKPRVVSKRGRPPPQMRKVQEQLYLVRGINLHLLRPFKLPLLLTSSFQSSASSTNMASIPIIESEVDFHVEGAGKPCKTVSSPFLSCHVFDAMLSTLLSEYSQRLSSSFPPSRTPLRVLFSSEAARTKFRYDSVD